LLRDLPPRARWYIVGVIALGGLTFALLIPRAEFAPLIPLLFLTALSSLTSAFKVHFPIAGGSNMSVSYVVDIASLILRGPHATMIVGALSGWTQTTVNSQSRNPAYRTLFNMACLVLTVQAAGQAYQRLGGSMDAGLGTIVIAVSGMAVTYFAVNTVPIAVAIALTTNQDAWQVWKRDFASSIGSYVLGAAMAYVVIAVTERTGYGLMLLLAVPPLYLTYRVYRTRLEAEARQGAILEAANDAIVTMDHNLAIREFNPAAERMFGYERINILGRNVEMLLPTIDRPSTLTAFRDYMTHGRGPLRGGQLEIAGLRADGSEFPAEVTVARVSPTVITGFIRDITERRAMEEHLRQSQKLEAIGRLAGGVAHDFNNILMSIMGSADLMLMDIKPNEPAYGEADEIKQSVQRGAGLTRQLLAFSRRQATSPKLFALNDAIGGMDTMLRRLMGPEIEFISVRPPHPTMVVADQAQIEQVVLNLVVNARDAMPEGGRLVLKLEEVELDDADAMAAGVERGGGRYAQLSVTDTGTGIDEQTRARLFEPFFTTKDQGKGTGLGLSIVYGIVKQSHGHIKVASEPGKGAMFSIYLPLASVPKPAVAEVPA
jgi:PAS domain S-box-containing protein